MKENSMFVNFWQQFEQFFARSETRNQAKLYVQGLLDSVARKNSWQLSATVGQTDPQAMQRLLYNAKWDEDALCQQLRHYICGQIGHHEGVAIIGEYSFIKKGRESAGVKPQWSLQTMRMENSQVGVFLGYSSCKGAALIDRRLFLPRDWCNDEKRRKKAKIPPQVMYLTKPEIAENMLDSALSEAIQFRWVLADSIYGNLPNFRDFVAQKGKWYIVEVLSLTSVKIIPDEPEQSVEKIVSNWIDMRWENPLEDAVSEPDTEWCCQRVISPHDKQQHQWLIATRSGKYPYTYKYYLSNAPADMPLIAFVTMIPRYDDLLKSIDFAKQETGLAQYEVRHWNSWYRHITLSMLASTWLSLKN